MSEAVVVSDALADLVAAGFTLDQGSLETIFIRPETETREELQEATLSKAEGVVGDRWKTNDPRTQITLMNRKVLDCVCYGDRSRWEQAGDQLIVDLDLSLENLPVGQRLKIGETTVEVRGAGRGGRNQELVLGAALALHGSGPVLLASMGTDGIDGASHAAGAFADHTTIARAEALGLNAGEALAANDSTPFFEALDDLIVTGPTGTNVMDVQIVLIPE